jgi:non-canonical purine NTP pyrophosphatase (RdgB/HAM1 family)
MDLLIATKNAGKIRELNDLLRDASFRLRSLDDFPELEEPVETGATFAENAELKAVYYAERTGLRSVADDSGLEVAALGNRPGVYTSRYGGSHLSFAEKMALLLAELKQTGSENRRARFVCAMSVADSKGVIEFTAEGVCDGAIAAEARGLKGFGYDPVFIPDGFDKTFGELPTEVKRLISHRARAVFEIIHYLQGFTDPLT